MQTGQIQRQGAVLVVLEVETNLQRAFDDPVLDLAVEHAIAQAAFGHQRVVGKGHVLGGDRRVVSETGLGVQVETHPQAVGVALDLLRDKPVNRIGLVQRAEGQGGIHPLIDLGDTGALVDIGRQVGELTDFHRCSTERTALGRVRVYKIEVLEVGRVFGRFAIHRQGMAGRGVDAQAHAGQHGHQQRTEQGQEKCRHHWASLYRVLNHRLPGKIPAALRVKMRRGRDFAVNPLPAGVSRQRWLLRSDRWHGRRTYGPSDRHNADRSHSGSCRPGWRTAGYGRTCS